MSDTDLSASLGRLFSTAVQEPGNQWRFLEKYRPITSPTSGLDTVAICFSPLLSLFSGFSLKFMLPATSQKPHRVVTNAAQVILNGIFGVPFYVLGMAFLNIWYLMLVVWFLLSLPLKALGLVQRGTFSHKREPQINTQVDLEE